MTDSNSKDLEHVEALRQAYAAMKQEMKKERRRKIFWKCATIVTSATTLYFFVF